mmetsp:Transcript_31115/g.101413  ORF Transcript_31115/g.101413 Transcript_31115/m.101413 type:complete len:221 (-) Transcript_31115:274-936(-)
MSGFMHWLKNLSVVMGSSASVVTRVTSARKSACSTCSSGLRLSATERPESASAAESAASPPRKASSGDGSEASSAGAGAGGSSAAGSSAAGMLGSPRAKTRWSVKEGSGRERSPIAHNRSPYTWIRRNPFPFNPVSFTVSLSVCMLPIANGNPLQTSPSGVATLTTRRSPSTNSPKPPSLSGITPGIIKSAPPNTFGETSECVQIADSMSGNCHRVYSVG